MRLTTMLRSSLAVCALVGVSAPAFAEDLTFQLTNLTSSGLTEFYLSPSNVNNWEDNLLDGAVLPSGNTIPVTVGDGRSTCVYDIQSIFQDGDKVEERGVDLCALGSYTLK